jgi:hypothetical protein
MGEEGLFGGSFLVLNVFPSSSQGVPIKFPKCPILFGHGSTSIYRQLVKGEGNVWLWIKGKHDKVR